MERVVSVLRVKANGDFILHPLGTFKGYAGYVGINPYRELPNGSDASSLGATAAALMEQSISTGYNIRDIERYRQETSDEETTLIRSRYFANIRSTDDTARRFQHAEISQSRHRISWKVTQFIYDKEQHILSSGRGVRIKIADGSEALGRALLQLLPSG